MTDNLVRRLRTCSAEERPAVAMELARTGTDESVQELIRMVEGRHRKGLSWYNLDDQLTGVESLGETKSINALQYLQRAYSTTNVTEETESEVKSGGSDPRDDDVYTVYFEVHHFPLARRALAISLSYRTVKSVSEEYYGELEQDEVPHLSCLSPYSKEEPEHELDERVHETFRTAIAKLESSLNQRPA